MSGALENRISAHLCEWAAANKDGTWTVVRGGITHWDIPRLPLNLGPDGASLVLFVDIPGGILSNGDQEFTVSFELPDGARLWERAGRLRIKEGTKPTRMVIPLEASIQKPGNCRVLLALGGQQIQLVLDVREGAEMSS